METNKIPTTARKAIEWLRKMNIEVKPVIGFDDMYIFKYNDVFLFIRTDTKPKELFLGAPVFLMGETNAENKAIFEIADYDDNNGENPLSDNHDEFGFSIVPKGVGEAEVLISTSHLEQVYRYDTIS